MVRNPVHIAQISNLSSKLTIPVKDVDDDGKDPILFCSFDEAHRVFAASRVERTAEMGLFDG